MIKTISDQEIECKEICMRVRTLMKDHAYEQCYKIITETMKKYPHAPHPHNLLGMLLENEGKHLLAMKHFRAAWALDPTYLPARYNLEVYGTFFIAKQGVYDESECPNLEETVYKLSYDKNNIGKLVRR